jgi:hypothetical protein
MVRSIRWKAPWVLTFVCMYNRYVDGLATWAPDDESIYRQMADRVVKLGYTQPGWEKPFPVHKQETDVPQTK